MTKRETVMLILSAYKIHCSDLEKNKRHIKNKNGYNKWLKQKREKPSKTNYQCFKKSHWYLRTLSLDEFAVKTLKALPEIDLL
jgi:hypothetical protein